MKTLPKSFCIKSNQKHELWNKFIQWINEKGGKYEGLLDCYYGINYCGNHFSDTAWGKVITLEQWYEAVNAK